MIDKTTASFSSVVTVNPLSCLGLFLLETVFACGNGLHLGVLVLIFTMARKNATNSQNNARTRKPEKL